MVDTYLIIGIVYACLDIGALTPLCMPNIHRKRLSQPLLFPLAAACSVAIWPLQGLSYALFWRQLREFDAEIGKTVDS